MSTVTPGETCASASASDGGHEYVLSVSGSDRPSAASPGLSRRNMLRNIPHFAIGTSALVAGAFFPPELMPARAEQSEPPAVSEATARLRAAQRDKPPLYPPENGVDALLRRVKLSTKLQQAIADGRLAIGEVGDGKPDARTRPVNDHQYNFITINSGMLDFMYALGSITGARAIRLNRDGTHRNEPVGEESDVQQKMVEMFRNWELYSHDHLSDWIWKRARPERNVYALDPSVLTIEEGITLCAELFFLCHELGHATANLQLVKPVDGLSRELAADFLGLIYYTQSTEEGYDPHSVIAGYGLSVRVLESLARGGMKFSDEYGDMRTRLELGLTELREYYRRRDPTDQYFDEASTLLAAKLQQMDQIDLQITGIAKPWNSDLWRRWEILVSLIGVSVATINNNTPESTWLGMFRQQINRLNPADAKDVVRTLGKYYLDPTPRSSLISEDVRQKIGAKIRGMIPDLPPSEQQLFELN
jgi:hypothetical protein